MELYAAIAVVVGVALLFFVIANTKRRTDSSRYRAGDSPPGMRFTCARCSGLFVHTKRTVAAWKVGSRRIFCDDCHKKWRSAQPADTKPKRESAPSRSVAQPMTSSRHSVRSPAPSSYADTASRRGCLGISIICVALPLAVLVVVTFAS